MTTPSDNAKLLDSARRSAEKLVADLERRRSELSSQGVQSAGCKALDRTLSAAKNVLATVNQRKGSTDSKES